MSSDKGICLSGGAAGADITWGTAATKAGYDCLHFTFIGHKTEAPKEQIVILSDEQLSEADYYLAIANKTLRRKWPVENPHVKKLLQRNYYQINSSDSLYAVASFDKNGQVVGGTAWAVQMKIDRTHNTNMCFIFDQDSSQWFQWNSTTSTFLVIRTEEVPVPQGIWAGIGSRKLQMCGWDAIQEIFNRAV